MVEYDSFEDIMSILGSSFAEQKNEVIEKNLTEEDNDREIKASVEVSNSVGTFSSVVSEENQPLEQDNNKDNSEKTDDLVKLDRFFDNDDFFTGVPSFDSLELSDLTDSKKINNDLLPAKSVKADKSSKDDYDLKDFNTGGENFSVTDKKSKAEIKSDYDDLLGSAFAQASKPDKKSSDDNDYDLKDFNKGGGGFTVRDNKSKSEIKSEYDDLLGSAFVSAVPTKGGATVKDDDYDLKDFNKGGGSFAVKENKEEKDKKKSDYDDALSDFFEV